MLRTALKIVLASGLCLTAFGCAAETERLRADVRRLEDQLAVMQRSQAELQAKVEESSNALFILEDKVDTNRQYIATLKKNQTMRIVQLQPETAPPPAPAAAPKPVAKSEPVAARPPIVEPAPAPAPAAAPKPAPKPVAKAAPEPAPTGGTVKSPITNPEAFYKQALAQYEAQHWDACISEFDRFVRELPNHDYADNSLYWKGECFYSQSLYEDALKVFAQVAERYPSGNKAPDALLKMALSYKNLGDNSHSAQMVQRLLNEYPFSDAASRAQALTRE